MVYNILNVLYRLHIKMLQGTATTALPPSTGKVEILRLFSFLSGYCGNY